MREKKKKMYLLAMAILLINTKKEKNVFISNGYITNKYYKFWS